MSWLMFCKKSIAFMALFIVVGVGRAWEVIELLLILTDGRPPRDLGRGGSYLFRGNCIWLYI